VGLSLFKLEKLKIEAYTTVERNGVPKTMEVMFNPTEFSEKGSICYFEGQSVNTHEKELHYSLTRPGEVTFKLIFDGTGVNYYGAEQLVRAITGEGVAKDIARFKALCVEMNGSIHQPNYLLLRWGKWTRKCMLSTYGISYKRFDRGGVGEPLHAELEATFINDDSIAALAAKSNKNSPDLTHLRVVKSGDTLPLLCKEIYGSSGYYLRVAADNGLDDFRNLRPGQKLRFRPLEPDAQTP
jgi:hypothetical protein